MCGFPHPLMVIQNCTMLIAQIGLASAPSKMSLQLLRKFRQETFQLERFKRQHGKVFQNRSRLLTHIEGSVFKVSSSVL